jgi:hypothetical protein
VAGHAGLPASGVEAAVVTLTVTDAGGAGFVTAWPCDTAKPEVSNLNFTAGATVPNLATVAVGAAGNVCLFTSAAVNLVVDLSAWYGTGDNRAASVVPTTRPLPNRYFWNASAASDDRFSRKALSRMRGRTTHPPYGRLALRNLLANGQDKIPHLLHGLLRRTQQWSNVMPAIWQGSTVADRRASARRPRATRRDEVGAEAFKMCQLEARRGIRLLNR